jgi:Flp pilus assembly pilin Flp
MPLAHAIPLRTKAFSGQSLVEYALILALVSVVCAGTLTTLGQNINTTLGKVVEVSGSNGAVGDPDDR